MTKPSSPQDLELLTEDEAELLYPGARGAWRVLAESQFGMDDNGILWCLYVAGNILFLSRYWTGLSWRAPQVE